MRMHLVSLWMTLVAATGLAMPQSGGVEQKGAEQKGAEQKGETKKVEAKQGESKQGETKQQGEVKKQDPKTGEKKDPKKTKQGTEVELPVGSKDAKERKEDVPIPDGATEEDIRAIRGANAMLKVEVRLKQLLKKLKVKGDAEFLRFSKIDSWIYEDGFKGMPKSVKELDGKQFVMAGFMLPIDEVENIKSFYLVESLWSCCFGTPPDVNGLVRVEVKAKDGIAYHYDPILVVGKFRLKKTMDDDYCVSIYTLEADRVSVLDLDGK